MRAKRQRILVTVLLLFSLSVASGCAYFKPDPMSSAYGGSPETHPAPGTVPGTEGMAEGLAWLTYYLTFWVPLLVRP